jgi:hypothetical protein
MGTAFFMFTTQPLAVIPYQRFCTTYQSDILTLEEWTNCPEKSVRNYDYWLR